MVQDGLKTENLRLSGLAVDSLATSGSVTMNAGNIVFSAGSPYSQGVVLPMIARAIISGGMFVAGSGGLAFPAPASTPSPIGIALATTASGATVNVLVRGVYPVICEGTLAVGVGAQMGAGGALNTVGVGVNASGTRNFVPLSSAASGTASTVFVLL